MNRGWPLVAVTALAALATLAAIGRLLLLQRCEDACRTGEAHAQEAFERGDSVAALHIIDEVDRRCSCSRFTEGDAPPEYSLAQAALRALHTDGRASEASDVLREARGPILAELRDTWGVQPEEAPP